MISITTVIVAVTVLAYFLTSRNREAQSKLIFNSYQVVHHKQWWRLFSHGLLHADGMHLAINMFVFWSFGSNLETTWTDPELFKRFFPGFKTMSIAEGRIAFLLLYVGALAAGSLPAIIKHKDNPGYNAVGASGAVSAVLIAYAILFPLSELELMLLIPMPSWVYVILFFVYEAYMNKRRVGNVAHDAHMAGGVFGLIFVTFLSYEYLVRFAKLIAISISNLLG